MIYPKNRFKDKCRLMVGSSFIILVMTITIKNTGGN